MVSIRDSFKPFQCKTNTNKRVRVIKVCAISESTSKPQVQSTSTARASRPLVYINPASSEQPILGRRALLHGGLSLAAGALCPCCVAPPAQAKGDWSYMDKKGPVADWPSVCDAGQSQSPIDLPLPIRRLNLRSADKAAKAGASPNGLTVATWKFGYKPKAQVNVIDTGHGTPQMNFTDGNEATFNGQPLKLLQFHYHTPSEHTLDGIRFPAEVHLVHKNQVTGKLHVVGILLNGVVDVLLNSEHVVPMNRALQIAVRHGIDGDTETINLKAGAAELLPDSGFGGYQPFIHYTGSLTTPPCSEDVDWTVLTTPLPVPAIQIMEMQNYHRDNKNPVTGNARPVQDLYGRSPELIV